MSETFRNSVKMMVQETFEGPPVPVKGSWFTNSEPNSGIFGVIEGISCDQASMSVHGTTLAAHIDHIRYHMWGTNEILKKGKQPEMDWGKSWDIHSVDEQQWNLIQEGLRNEYLTLLESFDVIEWNELLSNEVLSSLAHSAYHLGAIRQMVKVVKA
ncbi:hypothetical protein OEV98_15770 [Caldibacillus lycopersici]|uniref:DinB family protein n=1 Tax=Perspicuibacillus lycopersici TaxID=1325689 RepID=A0AAE3IUT2_9BACI|nr:hypothetical protein [Perspicuibacillus lycopersici]MCU9614993.1 hypothetical protein [Perspicuibacillus lycopersici]